MPSEWIHQQQVVDACAVISKRENVRRELFHLPSFTPMRSKCAFVFAKAQALAVQGVNRRVPLIDRLVPVQLRAQKGFLGLRVWNISQDRAIPERCKPGELALPTLCHQTGRVPGCGR